MAGINEGKPALEAAKSAFGDLKQLDKELDRYMMRSRLNYWKLTPDRIRVGNVNIRTLSPAEDAVMDVKIRSRRGVDRAKALQLLPEVRRAAAPFPNDAFAQATLAEAEFDAGNYKEAEAAAERAIAANPKFVDALIYKAKARMAVAEAAKDGDAAKWKEVRRAIVAANRADPDDPEPKILFYTSFLAEGVEPTKNAAMGLVAALKDAPQDRGLRMMVAFQMLKDGRADDARNALRPVAFDPHGGEMAKAATDILAKLDSSGTKAALEGFQPPRNDQEPEPS
jgi:tetratricopeptide (TPR) repeat protein